MTRSTVLLALAVAGCSFTEIPPPPGSVAVNQCDEDNECNGGKCRGDICVSTSTKLATLLTEVIPPTSASDMGGMAFYTELQLTGSRGNIAIGPVGIVTGTINSSVDLACQFQGPPPERSPLVSSGGTIPASLTFVPSERVLGVSTQTYLTSAGPPDRNWIYGEQYRFSTNLPPGDYDIYVEPRAAESDGADEPVEACDVPPLLIRRQTISGTATLSVELPSPSTLELIIRGPAGDQSLTGWTVELLDSLSGRVLSVPHELSAPTLSETSSDYKRTVVFVPAYTVVDGELQVDRKLAGFELVRLSPPENVAAPSFLFERRGIGLSGPGVIEFTRPEGTPVLPVNITVEGQTYAADTNLPVEAAVTLAAANTIENTPSAYFITTVQVDENGKFAVDVPPGTYQVRATPPPMLGLAAAETEWTFRSDLPVQAGKSIPLPRAPFLSGEAIVNGGPAFGATASAVVSPLSVKTTVLQRTLATPPVLPRSSAAIVQRDGRFDISVDPGLYDFFVRPEARSSYPWLVSPSISVADEGLNLKKRRLSLPFVYRGDVVVDGTPTRVPSALIRAYAYVTSAGQYTSVISEAASVVPVAETRTDQNGAFELLIPASLDGQ